MPNEPKFKNGDKVRLRKISDEGAAMAGAYGVILESLQGQVFGDPGPKT
ncbi:MAG: hypothetical protein OSB07_03020 [Dehalococcoidia bacterium]|nr:hypothetical protein [Dehalococcoidia bacterium]